ncbi:DUF2267 domain-containing protein [Nocardia wallacei]|uniref:DUF2267 domain-containing protein n=1 Tax=Nocardia wallacei TaxID=480035 RepID=UPI002454E52D|nr:DUF2267 domain-containing protein [Nocardia wallacei]
MKYQDLIESVRDNAHLADSQRARTAVSGVLTTVAGRLSPQARDRYARLLPNALEDTMTGAPQQYTGDGTALLTEVGYLLGVSQERARYITQAVIHALRDLEPDAVDLTEHLDPDTAATLAPAGESPDRATARVRTAEHTPLAADEIDRALTDLPEWRGDTSEIRRTVELPADRHDLVIDHVHRAARDHDTHTDIRRDATTLTFRLSTGHPPAVTERDLRLAARIDDIVATVGSGGHPRR